MEIANGYIRHGILRTDDIKHGNCKWIYKTWKLPKK